MIVSKGILTYCAGGGFGWVTVGSCGHVGFGGLRLHQY